MLSPPQENEVLSFSSYQPSVSNTIRTNVSTPPKDLRTPVKSLAHGYYFHGHQYSNTPTTRPHLGLLSGVSSPHTPKSGCVSRTANLNKHRSGDSRNKSTPKYTTPGGTSHRIIRNPFESPGQYDTLQNHVFSPSCFKHTGPGSAEKTPTSFRWSIDQIAQLNPAEIEEMPIQQDTLNIRTDSKTEAQLQRALDSYFTNDVAPSPLTRPLPKHILPPTPGRGGSPMLEYLRDTGKFEKENTVEKKPQADASCQTTLTLPINFDLQTLLADHYSYAEKAEKEEVKAEKEEEEEEEDGAMRSLSSSGADTSSLRRKLFFHGDLGTPLSPVRQHDSRHSAEGVVRTPDMQQCKLQKKTAQFSSSPIRPGERTPLRRCSTAPDLEALASPMMSPIIITQNDVDNESSVSRSLEYAPMHATPSPCPLRGSRVSMELPAMSPIHSGDGSYLQPPPQQQLSPHDTYTAPFGDGCSASPPPLMCMVTSNCASPQLDDLYNKPAFSRSPSPPLRGSSFSMRRSSTIGRPCLSPEDFDDGVSLLSDDDEDINERTADPASSQDTGYNTEPGMNNSATMSTNHSAHTNLTTQFGQLPLDSSSTSLRATAVPFLTMQDADDNACFEMAIPISTRQHHRPMSMERQTSLPEPFLSSEPQSLHSSLSETTNSLMSSLPEHILAGSIPISISRQPSVSFEQVVNEASPPSNNATSIPPTTSEADSDAEIIRRARRILGKAAESPDAGRRMEEEEERGGVPAEVPGLGWYMSGSSTPQRRRLSGLARTLKLRQKCGTDAINNMLPSEVAFEVLKKAGTDFDKVCKGQQLDDTCYEDADHVNMSFTSTS